MTKSSIHWNKGRRGGQNTPLKLKEIGSIRRRFQMADKSGDLALFNLAIDSKLRDCDLVSLRAGNITREKWIVPRAMVMQRKTRFPVQFEVNEQTAV